MAASWLPSNLDLKKFTTPIALPPVQSYAPNPPMTTDPKAIPGSTTGSVPPVNSGVPKPASGPISPLPTLPSKTATPPASPTPILPPVSGWAQPGSTVQKPAATDPLSGLPPAPQNITMRSNPTPSATPVATPPPVQTITPPPTPAANPNPVATPAPSAAAPQTITPKDNPKPQVEQPAEANPASSTMAPPSTYKTAMDNLLAITTNMANGVPDPAYKAALNQTITQAGLMDQADKDALQMQINQDPNLRGQGAGYALLQVLARNQNLNLDQVLGQLSVQSLDKIIQMQQYGITQGTNLLNTIRSNQQEDIKTMMSTGQWGAAASQLQSFMNDNYPGLNMNVDAASLQARDPQELTKMTQKLDFIKDLTGKDPAAALPLITSLMSDPLYAGYFPKGMTADQVVKSLASGQVSANIQQANEINTQINTLALPGADGKSQSFDETGSLYPNLFAAQGRDAVKEGQKLSLEDINSIRTGEGLPAFQKDASGNIVDENGMPLTSEDYTDLAYRKDYADKISAAKTQPWQTQKQAILSSPIGKYFTDEKLYPGANNALDKMLMANSTGLDLFTKDPSTGEMIPNASAMGQMLTNPMLSPLIQNWPTAVFDAQGNVAKDANGNLLSTPGGTVYGDVGPDGKVVLSTPQDQAIDANYFSYRNTGGTLDPTSWYYATQGGKAKVPDPSKIPSGVNAGGEDFKNVGIAPNPTPGVTSIPTPDQLSTVKGRQDAFNALVDSSAGFSTPDAQTAFKADMVRYRDLGANLSPTKVGGLPDNGETQAMLSAADARLKSKGISGNILTSNFDVSRVGGLGTTHESWDASQKGFDYAIYTKMISNGLSEADAQKALSYLVGNDRAIRALDLEGIDKGATNMPNMLDTSGLIGLNVNGLKVQ